MCATESNSKPSHSCSSSIHIQQMCAWNSASWIYIWTAIESCHKALSNTGPNSGICADWINAGNISLKHKFSKQPIRKYRMNYIWRLKAHLLRTFVTHEMLYKLLESSGKQKNISDHKLLMFLNIDLIFGMLLLISFPSSVGVWLFDKYKMTTLIKIFQVNNIKYLSLYIQNSLFLYKFISNADMKLCE